MVRLIKVVMVVIFTGKKNKTIVKPSGIPPNAINGVLFPHFEFVLSSGTSIEYEAEFFPSGIVMLLYLLLLLLELYFYLSANKSMSIKEEFYLLLVNLQK